MQSNVPFHGAITALITPFNGDVVDAQAFQDFVEWQIAEGIHGLVPCGTTGESPTLTHEEHKQVVALCVEAADGRVPVIAGTGSNSTAEAVSLSQDAEAAGADALLQAVPYYNKPSEEGLYAHFKAVHDAVSLPIILYNIPGRSVLNMSDAFIARLAALPNIVGIKDATGDLARVSTLRQHVGTEFCQLSGEDMTALAFNAMGGHGCISVTSNIAPKKCADMHEAWFRGEAAKALHLHEELVPLHDVLFCETSPSPAKYAASLMGKCSDALRLPLALPVETNQRRIREVLEGLGLV